MSTARSMVRVKPSVQLLLGLVLVLGIGLCFCLG
jgi:hypothetical protein